MRKPDKVEPAIGGGFVEIELANGWRELLHVSEISGVYPKRRWSDHPARRL